MNNRMQGCLEDEYARTPECRAAWRTVGRRRIGPRPESARRGLPLSPGPPRAAAGKRGCARRPRRLDPDALGFQPPLVSSRSWFPAALGFQPRWPDTRCRAGSGARLALSKKCEGVTHATVPTSCFDPAGRKHTEPTIRSERPPPQPGPGRAAFSRAPCGEPAPASFRRSKPPRRLAPLLCRLSGPSGAPQPLTSPNHPGSPIPPANTNPACRSHPSFPIPPPNTRELNCCGVLGAASATPCGGVGRWRGAREVGAGKRAMPRGA